MTIIPNSQSFSSTLPSGQIINLQATFKTSMDTVLTGLGRDITIHLPPSKSPCTHVDCKFNSTYQRYIGTTGKACEVCRGQGFLVEQRQTIYIANIRWANEPFDEGREEKIPAGRMGANFVRTKTVASSMDHIRSAVGATVDGINVEIVKEPRYTAFGPILYVISWWIVVNN